MKGVFNQRPALPRYCHIIIRQSMNHMAKLFIIFNIGECTLHNTGDTTNNQIQHKTNA
jgi:hypothetical protein